MLDENSLINQELYRVFVSQSSEGIWRMELEKPVAVDLPPDEQIELLYRDAYLAECNSAMARMYGYESPREIVGARFGDLLIREDQANLEHLVNLIDSDYRMEDAESHEVDRNGNLKFFLNNIIGIVEDGFLKRIWGTQREITGRKEIELSKAHLASIVESSDDAIISKDLDGNITSWNKGAVKIFGYQPAEIIGKSIMLLIPPHLIDEESKILEDIEKGISVEHFETLRLRKDGTPVSISLTVSPIKNDAGEIIGASKIARDITETKRVEESLRESEVILSLSMQSSRMGAWTQDLATDTVWWSEELEAIFGLEKGTFRGAEKDFFDLVHEDDREAIWNEIQRAVGEHREYTIEFRFRHTNGSLRWMEGRGRAVYSEKGAPVRLYGIGIDITERKKAEELLRRNHETFFNLVQNAPFGIYIIDSDFRLIQVSAGSERVFRGVEPLIGRDFADILRTIWNEPFASEAIGHFRHTLATGETYHAWETTEQRGNINYVESYDWKIERIVLPDGQFGVVCYFYDLSEQKQTEKALRESEERFAKAFNSSPLVLTITSLKTGKLIEVNETFVRTTGYAREETIGRSTAELGLWANPDDRREELKAVRTAGEIRDLEYRFRLRDGREIIGLLSAELLEIRGEPCALTVIQDITERKKAEVISDRYRLLSMRARDVILFFRPDGKIVDANRVAVETYGYDHAALLGMRVHELRAPETLELIDEQLASANKGGAQFETVHRRRDGSTFPVEVSSVGADIGGERLLISIIRDITGRRKNEEIARQSMKQLALVTDIAPVYIAHCGADMRFKFVNKTYAERFGMQPEACVGMPIAELLGREGVESVSRYIDIVLSGQPVEFELEIAYPSIGAHFMHCSYAPEFDDQGGVIGWVAAITDISERRKMEQAVRESEVELRQMANAMPQVVWIADAAGVVHYYNNRALEFFGVEKNEEGVWDWQPGVHEDDLAATVQAWQKAVKKKSAYVKEHRIKMADGGYRWHLSRAVPVLNAGGEVLKWYGTATDIHDLKQTAEALRESENRFRMMTNNAPMLVWMNDSEKLCTYFNQTWLDFTGRTMEEELGEGWTASIHPDDFERFREASRAAYTAREAFEMEYRLRRFDGEYRWILDKGVPLFTHNGTFRGYIGSCIDITERKLVQETLLRAERRASAEYLELLSRIVPVGQTLGTARDLTSIYRALHDFVRLSMPCTAFFVSSYDAEKSLRVAEYVWGEGGEVDVSSLPPMPITEDGGPNSQAIFQKRSVVVDRYWDLMKTRPHVILHEDGQDPNSSLVVPMAVMNRIIGTLEVQTYENKAFTKEHVIALEMVANLAAVAIENVRLLEIEAEARETAEAANRAKDEFLSVLSHELRTPLNSMLGWTRMLRMGVLDKEKADRAIEVIERNTLLQNNLIEDLLDVSRIISGKMRIEKDTVDLTKVYDDAMEILRPFAAQKKLAFEAAAPEGALIIDGDATRFQQIIVNLVQNAVKFTEEGGKIEVSLTRNGDFARLVVADNGIGIGEDLLPFIFDRFRQADSSTKRAYSGLGLGLTIVRNLVELHGGGIRAESAGRGHGTTFTVEIPLTEEFLEKTAAKDRREITAGENSALAGARILLVDDDFESLVPLQIFLEKEKAEIATATSAKDALEKLAAEDFHILITDIGMPLADGYDLIARVRQLQTEQNAFITAIALTAYASSDDRRRALAAGFQGHLAKPVDFDELLTVVKGFYEKMK
ncbi:MAG TPA: PAS domain S-box protein [Pyrinomonadaceae bacterium]